MVERHAFLEEPANTREAIMQATYHALCEYGYAGLTISRIAEFFEKSKSLLYHHYESKDELLLDFLGFMLEEFESVPEKREAAADERLAEFFDQALSDTQPEEARNFTRAMVELRAQAAHDDRFREHFSDSDQVFHDRLADIIQAGIESGTFRDVDSDRVAAFLLATINGAMTQQVTARSEDTDQVREELSRYVSSVLEP
ncbi:TetR/AcrR family transcriptional regulator [Halodesulfurarchaeum sp. HSR-GB]|uniref:TetR/AcrR family transcriptional regulator n=1 Tax=Halodesulfurarchaeum sp. HSR-GB TaxID=3074077 RepID=UPI00285B0FAB|nr:TetR/AcrR family transcriptional regulator [Halodesulfurarchaeum sp. HSR-GB]MDR5657537.1 TetR/AcrR family transcriptional regulator [Halodesulfurarchaeum sp. HSR-GB]